MTKRGKKKKIIKHARPGLFCAQLATRVEGQRYFI